MNRRSSVRLVSGRWRRAGALADLVAVLLFVGIGRAAHAHGTSLSGMASTAWPFLVGLVVGWVVQDRCDRPPVSARAGAIACGATVAVGMTLRVLAGQGTAAAFVLVALAFLGATMSAWRLVARRVRPISEVVDSH
jgi:hypothetical protein